MFREVLQYCKREKLIEDGDYVLAGVSGGADSVCMLKLLLSLQKEIRFFVEAVHVEHGIRGQESKEDAEFVVQLCRELKVPVKCYDVRALEYAKEHKLGLEEAARVLRYDCYAKAARETGAPQVKVALAHHADDNAETVLFQMVRGSGIDGMSGIRPKREWLSGVAVIRPLLSVTRKQIEEYLQKNGQAYCTDSTNIDMKYSRNKIRRQILPMLTEVNTQAVSHINQSAMLLRELGDYLKIQIKEEAERLLVERTSGIFIAEKGLQRLPEVIKKEVLHLALEKAAGSRKDIGLEHIEAVLGLFTLQTGRRISLPYNIEARHIYEGVLLEKKEKKSEKKAVEEEKLLLELEGAELEKNLEEGEVRLLLPMGEMKFSLADYSGENEEISKNRYTKCLDYDKIKGSFQIRTRRAGDYLIVDEDGHRKRLKEYFINEKVPSDMRDKILLLTQKEKVIWVIGGRISADAKVDTNTKRILKVQISGGDYYED